MLGYEYQQSGSCRRTGKPYLIPIAWSHPTDPVPRYGSCSCFPDCDKDEPRKRSSVDDVRAARLEAQTEKIKTETIVEFKRSKVLR